MESALSEQKQQFLSTFVRGSPGAGVERRRRGYAGGQPGYTVPLACRMNLHPYEVGE